MRYRRICYLVRGLSLERVRVILSKELGISFARRDSGWYRWEYYVSDEKDDEVVMVFINEDFEGEAIEGDDEERSAVVVSIEKSNRNDLIRQAVLRCGGIEIK